VVRGRAYFFKKTAAKRERKREKRMQKKSGLFRGAGEWAKDGTGQVLS